MGGSISGPALNGNITGGVAFPSTFNKGTLQSALITTYGISVDGESFLVQVNGIGTPSDQFASIVSSSWIL